MTDIYSGKDPRHIPTYSIPDAARYLGIPSTTLRAWALGRSYSTQQGQQRSEPLIQRPDPHCPQISFTNLIEAHVLRIVRSIHNVKLNQIRDALNYLDQQWSVPHPLARHECKTDGIDLFIEAFSNLVNVSRGGQLYMKGGLENLLERVEWDRDKFATRFFPLVNGIPELATQRPVLIDPRVSFGRPIIAGAGVATAVVTDLFNAGDTVEELAQEYDCTHQQIETAIQFESQLAA